MKYSAYPAYNDSGVEGLGEIPKHWEVKRLKWVVSQIGSGKTPKGGSQIYSSSGVIFLRSQNIHFDGLRLEDVVYIDDVIDKEMASTRVMPQDVLLNITGASLGRCSIVPKGFPAANVNQHVCIIRPAQKSIQPSFLLSAIASNTIQAQIFSSENGTSREGLTFSQIANLVLAVPSNLSEQQAIASFLDRETAKIDALIAKKERLIKLLQEKRTAIISHAVTKGLDPSVPLKDSCVDWLGKVPMHWRVIQLRRCWKVIDCKHRTAEYFDEGIPIVSTTEVKPGRLNLENTRLTSEAEFLDLTEGRLPKPGDIIYSRNASVGSAAYVDTEQPFCMGQDVCLITSTNQNQLFLSYLLNSPIVLGQLEALMVGSTINRINVGQIQRFWVLCPPSDEQAAIAAYLDRETAKIDALITKIREGIEKLKEYRTALISAAVTGKIDVRNEVAS